MNHRALTLSISPLLLLLGCGGMTTTLCSDQPGAAIATFEDASLEAAIRAALSVGAQDDLTCPLVSGLTRLDAEQAEIESLVGIQNLTALTNLDLWDNSISDLSPLNRLTGLTELRLLRNSINDISALSGLTGLTNLSLGINSISDISALSGLTHAFFVDSTPHQNANHDHPHQQDEVGRHVDHHHQFRKPSVGQDDGTSCGSQTTKYRQEANPNGVEGAENQSDTVHGHSHPEEQTRQTRQPDLNLPNT